MKRDDDTGKATLRITPRNADTVYVEVGGDATPASQKLDGRDYITDELKVSFLAVDSTGQHATGPAKPWANTITIKSLARKVGKNIFVTLDASPSAQIRYSTDGSNPKTHGGIYEGEFPVPENTRMVLAIAERNGIQSEQHTRTIDWSKTAPEFSVDPRKPADWSRKNSTGNTKETFEFLGRARNLDATIVGGGIELNSGDSHNWIELVFGDTVALTPEQIETMIAGMRTHLPDAAITLRADKLRFAAGQGLTDFAAQTQSDIKPDEVKQ
jgi:hypothetical protein